MKATIFVSENCGFCCELPLKRFFSSKLPRIGSELCLLFGLPAHICEIVLCLFLFPGLESAEHLLRLPHQRVHLDLLLLQNSSSCPELAIVAKAWLGRQPLPVCLLR